MGQSNLNEDGWLCIKRSKRKVIERGHENFVKSLYKRGLEKWRIVKLSRGEDRNRIFDNLQTSFCKCTFLMTFITNFYASSKFCFKQLKTAQNNSKLIIISFTSKMLIILLSAVWWIETNFTYQQFLLVLQMIQIFKLLVKQKWSFPPHH